MNLHWSYRYKEASTANKPVLITTALLELSLPQSFLSLILNLLAISSDISFIVFLKLLDPNL